MINNAHPYIKWYVFSSDYEKTYDDGGGELQTFNYEENIWMCIKEIFYDGPEKSSAWSCKKKR